MTTCDIIEEIMNQGGDILNPNEVYKNLPFDLSGSMAKNRFRSEILWGISKILELMEAADDFTVVFDYVCDIEVHKSDSLEFYQIKTHKTGKAGYTSKNIVKISNGQEGSILGKLYVLKSNSTDRFKLVIVCNSPFASLSNEPGEISFDMLKEEEKTTIIEALRTELGVENVDLSSVYYLYTHMNLENPSLEIKGDLISKFEKLKGVEPLNPNALYRLIAETVEEKACYEFEAKDYEELVKNKGITRAEFNEMLDAHLSNGKTGVAATQKYISGLKSVRDKKIYNQSLSSVISKIMNSKRMKDLQLEMALFLNEQDELGEVEECIDLLTGQFHDTFPIEYENSEKVALYMLVIHKFIEGGFDNEIGL